MVRKLTTVLLIGGALAIAACNTVRGAGEDRQLGRQLHRERDQRRQLLVVAAKKIAPPE